MHAAIPLSLAVLVSVTIMVIGCFYIAAPERVGMWPLDWSC